MGSKKAKAELIAEIEAMRHRLEALGQQAGNGGRGETDHLRVAEEVGEPTYRLKMGSERIPSVTSSGTRISGSQSGTTPPKRPEYYLPATAQHLKEPPGQLGLTNENHRDSKHE